MINNSLKISKMWRKLPVRFLNYPNSRKFWIITLTVRLESWNSLKKSKKFPNKILIGNVSEWNTSWMIHNKAEEYDCVHKIVELSPCWLWGYLHCARNCPFRYRNCNICGEKENKETKYKKWNQISRCCNPDDWLTESQISTRHNFWY